MCWDDAFFLRRCHFHDAGCLLLLLRWWSGGHCAGLKGLDGGSLQVLDQCSLQTGQGKLREGGRGR
ncbi:hypothetical protein E2C01_102386 [Portunus trituberculatus]|uniref:Uncharacterized protein n=1 Tax=Portunus trituberculatus TaxID=210409 RepID=A0A5B7KMP3_PORTR|nr:hypothetical protein [Portunus trituberculatus]